MLTMLWLEVTPRSVEPADVEQRGQNHQKDNIGIQRDPGQMGQEREDHAADEQHDRIRNFETLRERGQPSDQEHQKEECQLKVVNACGLHGAVSRDSRLTQRIAGASPRDEAPTHALNSCRGKACGLRMLLLGLRYALLEDIEANGSFVLV